MGTVGLCVNLILGFMYLEAALVEGNSTLSNPTSTLSISTSTLSPTPTSPYNCTALGNQAVTYDPRCCQNGGLGCGAGGNKCCRYCFQAPADTKGCPVKKTTTPGPPPTTIKPGPQCKQGPRCGGNNGISCQEMPCTSAEITSTPCQCNDNKYCCLAGGPAKGCSDVPWGGTCTCACKMVPQPTPNCTFPQYKFSPCNPVASPYYCPSTKGCGSARFQCVDLCFLTPIPPYPARPADTGSYTPSNQQTTQKTTCGASAVVAPQTCAPQPNSATWSHHADRQKKCSDNSWWCPTNLTGWTPSKHQCGAPILGTIMCPIKTLQAQACPVSAPYKAPSWAPQPLTSSTYCDTSVNCNNVKDAQHCIGCCSWNNPSLSCSAYWQVGKGTQCKQVAPRFNWIITTCDTNGGVDFGGACQQNPFSTVDVRYIAVYKLTKNSQGQFVWQIIPDSSLNWNGTNDLIDFSNLPTEHSVGAAVQTPPAFMFVLSYKKFVNAAWFMLNQRILNGGPEKPTAVGAQIVGEKRPATVRTFGRGSDARGTTVYKDPDWQGITPTCAAEQLVNLHPNNHSKKQPCSDANKSCAMYIPGCVTNMTSSMTQITNGVYSRIPNCYYRDQSVSSTCTENWWNLMMDTGQWIVNDPPAYNGLTHRNTTTPAPNNIPTTSAAIRPNLGFNTALGLISLLFYTMVTGVIIRL